MFILYHPRKVYQECLFYLILQHNVHHCTLSPVDVSYGIPDQAYALATGGARRGVGGRGGGEVRTSACHFRIRFADRQHSEELAVEPAAPDGQRNARVGGAVDERAVAALCGGVRGVHTHADLCSPAHRHAYVKMPLCICMIAELIRLCLCFSFVWV